MKTIKDRTKEAREALGLNQVQLAKLAGVSPGTIGNLESGTRKNPRELLAIAAALKVSPQWLKSGKGERDIAPSADAAKDEPRNDVFYDPQPQRLSRQQKLFLDLLEKLPVNEQGEVYADLTGRASRRLGEELLAQQVDLSVFRLPNQERRRSDQGHEPERRTATRHDDREIGSRTMASKSSIGGEK